MKNPAQIRTIFGENLQQMAQGHTSVTALAHELGINRTQFNRYLSGESFPRPDVLARICTFFKVDARILLQPLDEIDLRPAKNPECREDGFVVMGTGNLPEETFPSGFYRFSRRSFIDPELFVIGLIFVFRDGPNTYLRGFETSGAMRMQSLPPTPSMREFRGTVFQQEQGIAIMASRKNAMTSSFNYLSRVASFDNNFWVGYITRTVQESPDSLRATRLVYEYLPQNLSDILQAARGKGFYKIDQLAPFHRRLLKPDQPFA